MPKLKKVPSKKEITKTKKSQAKALSPKAAKSKLSKPKTASAKLSKKAAKPRKAKPEDLALHHVFDNSLAKLKEFWQKKSIRLKKEIDALRAKYDKAALKQKATKSTLLNLAKTLTAKPGKAAQNQHAKAQRHHEESLTQANLAQAALHQAKEALANAKRATDKYVALGKMIKQFEIDWTKNLADTPKVAEKAAKSQPINVVAKKDTSPLQSKVKMVEIDVSDLDEDLDEDLEEDAEITNEDLFISLENEFYPEENAELTDNYKE